MAIARSKNSTKLTSIDVFAESLTKDTVQIRKVLKAYIHFVPLSIGVVAEFFAGLDTSVEEITKIWEGVYKHFTTKYPLNAANSLDTTNIVTFINNNSTNTRRLGNYTSIGVYKASTLVGILTSNYDNASSEVVRVIQNKLGTDIPLAVGHVVGEVANNFVHYKGTAIGGHSWIKNNLAFRSPLSMKLSIIGELFSMAEAIASDNIKEVINWYFNAPDGENSTKRTAKRNFIILADILYASGKAFKGPLHALHRERYTGFIARSNLERELKAFSNTYFKIIEKKIFEKSGANITASQINASIQTSINNIAAEHKKYYDRVIDSSVMTKDFTDTLASLKVLVVLPMTSKFNSGQLSALENRLAKQAFIVNFEENRGSPSLVDYVEDAIVQKLLGTKAPNFKQNKKAIEGKIDVNYSNTTTKITSKVKKPVKHKVSSSSIVRLRSTSGAFQSVVNLQGLLSARLQEVIRKNMAPPALTYQTGRFAESVKLNSVQFDSRQNALTAFLSYMKYPYATFEVGGRQGSIDKSPSSLIDRSVREIAAQLTKSRMKTIVV